MYHELALVAAPAMLSWLTNRMSFIVGLIIFQFYILQVCWRCAFVPLILFVIVIINMYNGCDLLFGYSWQSEVQLMCLCKFAFYFKSDS